MNTTITTAIILSLFALNGYCQETDPVKKANEANEKKEDKKTRA